MKQATLLAVFIAIVSFSSADPIGNNKEYEIKISIDNIGTLVNVVK